MTNPASNIAKKAKNFRLNPMRVIGVAALLAPLSYAVGRLNVGTELEILAWGGLGMLLGLPLGLAYGAFRPQAAAKSAAPNSQEMEKSILEQLKVELSENQALFEARKGNSNMYARIEYLTGFWESIKASGRLFVMQDAALLGTVGAAYFWLAQATHLETLAYEAKYASGALSGPTTAQQLVGEARLLDGQLENSLNLALKAIDDALAA
jgi:hypothetical protein